MHKRNKKNKQKHPNPTPPQKKKDEQNKDVEERQDEELIVEEVSEIKENVEKDFKDESIPEKTIIEEKAIEEETPKSTPAKPKRNKSAKNNKSNDKEGGNDKGREEIIDDSKEQNLLAEELKQKAYKTGDDVPNIKLGDIKNKEEVDKKQENVIPIMRKKRVKQIKDEQATDEVIKGVYEEQCQNVATSSPENEVSVPVITTGAVEGHSSKAEYIDKIPCSTEQKSGKKKKNKKGQKTYNETTAVFEKSNTTQIEEKVKNEGAEIKLVEEKNEIVPGELNKSKDENQINAATDVTEETVLVSAEEEINKSVFTREIQESGDKTEVGTDKIMEIKKEEPQTKPHKNKSKNKKKQADFTEIKYMNKQEHFEGSKGLTYEINEGEGNSPNDKELKISGTRHNENPEIKKSEAEQTKKAEAILFNRDILLPTDNDFTCISEKYEFNKDLVISKEECLESNEFANLTKEVTESISLSSRIPMARLILQTLPPLPEDDNNLEDNSDIVEEVVNTEFEKLLADSPEPVLTIEEIPQTKKQSDENDNTDPVNYAPLSESNIDESCKKLFEALVVEDAAGGVKSIEQTITRPKKEEQFIIRLFDETLDVNTQIVSQDFKQSKLETTDLKGKVMEVNKDMEDLKLSIEKSLAELTAMESEEMPKLVSIADYKPLSSLKRDKETMMATNMETETSLKNEELFQGTGIKDIIQGETKDTLAKKNKGKGKCSKQHEKNHQNIEIKTTDTSFVTNPSEINEEQDLLKEDFTKNPGNDIGTDVKTTKCQSQCSTSETKGKGKGKRKQDEAKGEQMDIRVQSTNETSAQNPNETQQPSNNQGSKEQIKSTETAPEAKDSEKSKSGHTETFTDAMNSSLKDDMLFERKSSESTTSSVIPAKKEMIIDYIQQTQENKPSEENQDQNPLATGSKNLLGHPDIPVTSSKPDYKKEKDKNLSPNSKKARTKVKDYVEIEKEMKKCSKHSQTENKLKKRSSKSVSPESEDEEFVYQYSFRKVFLTNCCNICNTELKGKRFACGYCNLIFYCSQKHKDEDWPQHQALCFAVSTLVHLKGLKFIYGDAAGCNGQDYRLLRMQVIVSCEKILKRKLLACEQEALLYPRMCAEPQCREWKSAKLKDCEGCGLVAYCTENPEHINRAHQIWCKSYRLYHKLVTHQQSQGRLEPKMPSKVISEKDFRIPNKMNELLGLVYEEKIDMDDLHYAALTQLATAPLTAAYSYQLFKDSLAGLELQNGDQGKTFALHVVGAELQFEADTLNKWEVFFLHTRPDVQELRIVFVGPELNPSKLPLGLLAKIKMCKQCRHDKRKILFDYQDGQLYHNYVASRQFLMPDIVCAFNPGLHRKTGFGGLDSWPQTINSIIKLKVPFCVTSYTKFELPQDMARIKECCEYEYKIILEPTLNPFASIRPDRNFISDDEMPLIFKNYCVMILCGI